MADEVIQVLKAYSEPHRHYHNESHLIHMRKALEGFEDKLKPNEAKALKDAILYHDAVWQPQAKDNEEKSFELYLNSRPDASLTALVKGLIMATKHPFEPKTELEKLMVYIDWSHFALEPSRLHEINMAIFRELQAVPFGSYCAGRDGFLEFAETVPPKLIGKYVTEGMAQELINGIRLSAKLSLTFRPRIAIYAGSFNPLHNGHVHIIKKAEKVFDKVIIVQARNSVKAVEAAPLPDYYTTYYQTEVLRDLSIVQIVEKLSEENADYYLLRGIRNSHDLNEEQNFMRIIRDMGVKIPVHHILCDPEFQHISSSAIRSLIPYGYGDLYTP